jgi:hypothetical protein
VRRLALASLLLLSACTGVSGDRASAEGGGDDDGDDSGGGLGSPDATECQLAADCVAAASTCCECPAFAVASSSGYEEACSEVNCDLPADCAAVEPACNAGRCELICSPLVTELVCDEGFAHDDFGCLLEACAPGPSGEAGECDIHSDCVQVPADCCGCARGGSDTAVPADQVDPHLEGLDCPEQPYCPDVEVCEPDAEAGRPTMAAVPRRCRAESQTLRPVPTARCASSTTRTQVMPPRWVPVLARTPRVLSLLYIRPTRGHTQAR